MNPPVTELIFKVKK